MLRRRNYANAALFALLIFSIFVFGVFTGMVYINDNLSIDEEAAMSNTFSVKLRGVKFAQLPENQLHSESSSLSSSAETTEINQQTQHNDNNKKQTDVEDFRRDYLELIYKRGNSTTYFYCLKHLSNRVCSHIPSTLFVNGNHAVYKDSVVDAATLTVSAWMWLDPSDKTKSTKTILSTLPISMCSNQKNANFDGYAFSINDENDDDLSLSLTWKSALHGCEKIKTKANVVEYGSWFHVGFVLKNHNEQIRATIYVDGKVVASTFDPATYHRSVSVANGHWLARKIADKSTFSGLFIGVNPDGKFPFNGRIANLAIYNDDSGPQNTLLWTSPTSPPKDRSPPSEYKNAILVYYPLHPVVPISTIDAIVIDLSGSHHHAKMVSTLPSIEDINNYINNQAKSSGNLRSDSALLEAILKNDPLLMGKVLDVEKSLLILGMYPSINEPSIIAKSDAIGRERSKLVVNALKHVWGGYESKAFGYDELKPVSGHGENPWGGVGMTIVDSLDTLWLLGLKEEFKRAVDWISQGLDYNRVTKQMPVFEMNIRQVGGLLSAYELSKEPILLQKAVELGDKLLPAFNTVTGLPLGMIHFFSGKGGTQDWTGGSSILAEVGTMQLEFRCLSYHSGDPKYAIAAEKVYDVIRQQTTIHGMAPTYISPDTGAFTNKQISFGALGDSYFEYLLKVWIQGGKKEILLRKLYDNAIDGMHELLVLKTDPNGLTYVAEYMVSQTKAKMDHLACFVPGMLALGVHIYPDHPRAAKDLEVAKALMYTCYQMYARTPTGLSPEFISISRPLDFEVPQGGPYYILRPETAESLFILNHVTKHPIYRDWGHEIMMAIEKFTKTEYGYGSFPDVRSTSKKPNDGMESFFIAETLKYLYLLQNPDHGLDLKEIVFNTEAHPLKIFPDNWREKTQLSQQSKFLFRDDMTSWRLGFL